MGSGCSFLSSPKRRNRKVSSPPLPPNPSSSSAAAALAVRVVHLNGHVELVTAAAAGGAVTAGDVSSAAPNTVLCSHSELLRPSAFPAPLPLDRPLAAGELYLLLPESLFAAGDHGASPLALLALANRLAALAADPATPVEVRRAGKGPPGAWRPALDAIDEGSGSGAGSSLASSFRDPASLRPI